MIKKNISLKEHTKQIIFYFLVVSISLSSCEDEPQILGLNLIPDSDKVNVQYVDTFTVFAHTEAIDKQFTGYNAIAPIGNLHDPIFGYTNASLLTEYYPITPGDGFQGTDPSLDSIKLNLYTYSSRGYHGDTISNMKIRVYKYNAEMPNDSLLYSNFEIEEASLEKIGETEYNPKQDSITIYLKNSFGNLLLTPPNDHDRDMVLDSVELFHSLFKNIYIETEEVNNKGSINYFHVGSKDDAFISLHYHYTKENEDTTGTLYYTLGDPLFSVAYKNISIFKHDYSSSSFDPTAVQSDSVIYLQSLAGTRGVLKIPGLTDLFSSNSISVSSAKLLLPLEDFDKTKYIFPPSQRIGITAIGQDNSEFEIIDNEYIGYSSSGEVVNNFVKGEIDDSLRYELNITRHIEKLFNNEYENLGFNVFVANSLLDYSKQFSNRVVLTSHLNSNPIKLQIVYTKLGN